MTAAVVAPDGTPVLDHVAPVVEHGGGGSAIESRHELVEIGERVYEATLSIRNITDDAVSVTRMDAFAGTLAAGDWAAHWFTSSWGQEFTPHRAVLADRFKLGTHSGRSSNGTHPWLGLVREDTAIIICPAWSGNWHIGYDGGRITAGISPWRFSTSLRPDESVTAPSVVIATGCSLADAAEALTSAIGRSWIPRTEASDSMRVEWNHWWPYEDAEVNADVIEQNAAIAARLGIGQITVDAGWFGAPGDTFWEDVRGDWDLINTDRFPEGMGPVGASIRSHGALPGIWIEAEAVGPKATLRSARPELMAQSDSPDRDEDDTWSFPPKDPDEPGFLGYVCLGSPAGREFVANALDRAVSSIGAEWVKLDFNLDPGAGCTRTDHGHGAADGLYRHYLGLYEVLDAFRERHPEVILEACSSGGLRIDLGLARHVHCFFLSDPDYTQHHLQVLWGAIHMLPPAALLHWSWSQSRGQLKPGQLDVASISGGDFATALRAAMLQRFGVSLRLPELRDELLTQLQLHVRIYLEEVAPLLRYGVVVALTAQPLRDGGGERAPVFRVSAEDRHVFSVTLLDGRPGPTLLPTGLDPAGSYRARDLVTGRQLDCVNGAIRLDWPADETSCLILLDSDIRKEDFA